MIKLKLQENKKLKIRFSRLKSKLKESNKYYNIYLLFLGFIFYLFKPIKKYVFLNRKKTSKWLWLISYSIFEIFWYKSWYIDDFIISEKLRWKWVGKILLNTALYKIKKIWWKYAFLLWNTSRKESIGLYKKFGFTVISAGFLIVAYKKINKKR